MSTNAIGTRERRKSSSLDVALHRVETELLDPLDLALSELGERKLVQGRPAPELQRVLEGGERCRGIVVDAAPSPRREQLEATGIDLAVGDTEDVPGRLGDEHAVGPGRLEQPAEVRDVALDRLRRRGRRLPAPEGVHESVDGDDLAATEHHHRQERPLPPAWEPDLAAGVAANLERAEDLELHLSSRRPGLSPSSDGTHTGVPVLGADRRRRVELDRAQRTTTGTRWTALFS